MENTLTVNRFNRSRSSSIRSRSSSIASINELVGEEEDKSLLRAGEFVQLRKCEDEEFIANAYKYCQRCLAGSWAKSSADKFSVQFLSGGMTNYLYLCSLAEDVVLDKHEPRKVLIRIHGSIIDQKQRFYEGVIFTLLSERGYGPKTYGVFYSGRIEEFIPYRHLFQSELSDPKISKLIARKAGEYHCLKLPLNKSPTFLWENIEKYLDICEDIQFNKESEREIFESINKDINFREEYNWLRSTLIELNSPVVFCHNDLHEGNILYIEAKSKTDITLIDYDYSSYNYRGYDIGNHFCEWMYDYTLDEESGDGFVVNFDKYPTRKQQELFASEYLQVLSEFKEKMKEGKFDYQRFSSDIPVCTVDEFLEEVNRFTLASHFYWGLWSLVQVKISKIQFGYIQYARSRYDAYIKQKKEFGY